MNQYLAGAVFTDKDIYLYGGIIFIIVAVFLIYFFYLRTKIRAKYLQAKGMRGLLISLAIISIVYITITIVIAMLIYAYYFLIQTLL